MQYLFRAIYISYTLFLRSELFRRKTQYVTQYGRIYFILVQSQTPFVPRVSEIQMLIGTEVSIHRLQNLPPLTEYHYIVKFNLGSFVKEIDDVSIQIIINNLFSLPICKFQFTLQNTQTHTYTTLYTQIQTRVNMNAHNLRIMIPMNDHKLRLVPLRESDSNNALLNLYLWAEQVNILSIT